MEELFRKIEKNFVGLWKYQCYNNGRMAKTYSYCLTICVNGKHIDTHTHKRPINAFKEAIKIIEIENEIQRRNK